MSEAYRYKFRQDVDLHEAESTLLLSILAAEGLFGAARVRMDAGYAVDGSIRAIVVDASTDVGQAVCSILTAFLQREFGGSAFGVRAVEAQDGPIARECER